ncbi:PilZ domain-containing protein [Chondromyces crocatus]|uniref:PilZ domain-containing protein n=1 Tax=Chondromyces crocatus TaxID=52 RepID=UPI002480C26F|nr:PilZ domain-containing protein [Chondromyces crocatus]
MVAPLEAARPLATRDHFRAHPRRRVELTAMLRDRQTADEQTVIVRDLGLGGAYVELDRRPSHEPGAAAGWPDINSDLGALLEPELAVTIELTAPTLWDPLPLRGRVAWVRRASWRTRVGVRFDHHDAANLLALYDLLGSFAFEV